MNQTEPDPQDIVLATAGDQAAFARIVRLYQDRVYRLAYKMTFDANEALDLSQEAFVRLYRGLPSFDQQRPFTPWFMKIAANACLNALKRSRSQTLGATSIEAADGAIDPVSKERGAPGLIEDSETARKIRQAVRGLPPDYRVVVGLYYMRGVSCDEIAETLGIPVGTVKNRLFRARERLKNAVELRQAGIV